MELSKNLISHVKRLINAVIAQDLDTIITETELRLLGGLEDIVSLQMVPLNLPGMQSIISNGKIITPNKYITAYFYGKENEKLFWRDVVAEAIVRVQFNCGGGGRP